MSIIEQINELMETNQSLKEENSKFTDTLDEKDEAIQKLTEDNQILDTKLIQKSSQVDMYDKRLSDDMNGMKSKLAMYKNVIKDLKEQIDQTKINAIEAKDNEIAQLKVKVSELESQQGKAQEKAKTSLQAIFTEFMEAVNQSGYVKHRVMTGRYANNKPKYKTYYVQQDMAEHLKEYPQLVAQKQGENRLNRNS